MSYSGTFNLSKFRVNFGTPSSFTPYDYSVNNWVFNRIQANKVETEDLYANLQSSDLRDAVVIDKTTNQIKYNPNSLVAAGTVHQFAGSVAPDGYLLCDGSAVSRETYAALFDVINTTYGVGDGSSTFNVPNLVGKVSVGYDSGDANFNSLGKTGGASTVTLDVTQIPSHNHTGTTQSAGIHNHALTDPGHVHNAVSVNDDFNSSGTYPNYTRPSYAQYDSAGTITWTNTITSSTTGISVQNNGAHTHAFTSDNTGGGNSHNNLQPYITLNYIIKF